VYAVERHRGTLEELIKRLAWRERAPVKDVVLPIVASDEAQALCLDDAFNFASHPSYLALEWLALASARWNRSEERPMENDSARDGRVTSPAIQGLNARDD
jgi:hypothetical protein